MPPLCTFVDPQKNLRESRLTGLEGFDILDAGRRIVLFDVQSSISNRGYASIHKGSSS